MGRRHVGLHGTGGFDSNSASRPVRQKDTADLSLSSPPPPPSPALTVSSARSLLTRRRALAARAASRTHTNKCEYTYAQLKEAQIALPVGTKVFLSLAVSLLPSLQANRDYHLAQALARASSILARTICACMRTRKLITCTDACKQVSVKGKLKGVVKFVGATTFGPGVWVGVELDKPKGESPLISHAALDSATSL